jgi:hypothetical protein
MGGNRLLLALPAVRTEEAIIAVTAANQLMKEINSVLFADKQ